MAHAVLPEKSRALSMFVAVDYSTLPAPLRGLRDPRWLLAIPALLLIYLLAGVVVAVGLSVVAIGGILSLRVHSWNQVARSRRLPLQEAIRRVRTLEELELARSRIGLDTAMPEEALRSLEGIAVDWERLENTLQARGWRDQRVLAQDVSDAASEAMEELTTSEWRAIRDPALAARVGSRSQFLAERIRALADKAEEITNFMDSYPREEFDSNGAPLSDDMEPVAVMHRTLSELRSTLTL